MTDDMADEEDWEEAEASLQLMMNCDHQWRPITEADDDHDLWGQLDLGKAERCDRCGGTQVTVPDETFKWMQENLDD